jgi:hypothetical protein
VNTYEYDNFGLRWTIITLMASQAKISQQGILKSQTAGRADEGHIVSTHPGEGHSETC